MPKTKLAKFKEVKKPSKTKLSPAERSQIAKDRWAKRRKALMEPAPIVTPMANGTGATATFAQDEDDSVITTITAPRVHLSEIVSLDPKELERMADETPVREPIADIFSAPKPPIAEQEVPIPVAPPVDVRTPQLAPVKAPKPKRYTGPKEFSVALKAAENRLAKAINERAEAMGKLAGLNAEIPSLLQIIQALKGSGNGYTPASYDFSGSVPNTTAFQAPIPQQFQPPIDAHSAIMAAMAQPPISRASGLAVQLPPDVVGTLEGPEDDDNPDRFLSGPHAGGGWIGG